MSKLLPLRLKDLIFPAISVSALPPTPGTHGEVAHPHELDPETLAYSFRFDLGEEQRSASAGLRVRSEESAPGRGAPYRVDVEAFALFEANGHEHVDDKAMLMRRYSAAAALLGAIREQVATLTSRGPWGTAWIPMVSIEAMAKLPEEGRAAGKASATGKRAKGARRATKASAE
ncbi:MAG: hypothetical protein M9885_14815 [Burkholderiaceae bacterium]|nr:hypothetical protein [Burkholderiaceae bacterium]